MSAAGHFDGTSAFAERFAEARRQSLPLPGGGTTSARFERLATLARADMNIARLVEADADARAIAAELGVGLVDPSVAYAVWAAGGGRGLAVRNSGNGTAVVTGSQSWCGGAALVTRALLVVDLDTRQEIIDVEIAGSTIDHTSWRSDSFGPTGVATVTFHDAMGIRLTSSGDGYTNRAGFWHGAVGVAALWIGGLRGLFDAHVARWVRFDPHSFAQLGAASAEVAAVESLLVSVGAQIDDDPSGLPAAEQRARWFRYVVERACTRCIDHLNVGGGAHPLTHDEAIVQRTAEMLIAIRQSHGLRDLEPLGASVVRRCAAGA